MYDLIVIGGGPAGLTAIIYAVRKRLNALLLTENLGGKTNFRLQLPNVDHHLVINGEEVVNRFASEVEYLDFARRLDKVEEIEPRADGFEIRLRGGDRVAGRALVVASGANGIRLDVPGEDEFMMRGLCYSAVSYAPLFIGRDTVVIGDQALALRSAAELAQGARSVTLVAPTHGELDQPLGQRLLTAPNVTVLEGYRVLEVKGDKYARALVIQKGEEVRELQADAFFVELGLRPNSDLVRGLVELDDMGRIKIDTCNRTSRPGIFAAGDVTDAYAEQVLIAIGEGAKAALSAHEYLLAQPLSAHRTGVAA